MLLCQGRERRLDNLEDQLEFLSGTVKRMSDQVLQVHYLLKDIRKHLKLSLKPKLKNFSHQELAANLTDFVNPFPLTTMEQVEEQERLALTDSTYRKNLVSNKRMKLIFVRIGIQYYLHIVFSIYRLIQYECWASRI